MRRIFKRNDIQNTCTSINPDSKLSIFMYGTTLYVIIIMICKV